MTHFQQLITLLTMVLMTACSTPPAEKVELSINEIVANQDKSWVLASADTMLNTVPRSVTEAVCDRSEGGSQDFYSEGDYWWPNPDKPDGPYMRRDGMSNPENFLIHRQAMREMSITVASLTAAYKFTQDKTYADAALQHLETWFINPDTRMNPNMSYAQAIKGRVPGRGVGLIDGIHLVEPAQALMFLHQEGVLTEETFDKYQAWFSEFLKWMMTHEYGIDERDRTNNHGSCWVMQAGTFAKLTENEEVMAYCRDRYKTVLLPNQMAWDGSFHLELSRTKPYGYSLFNMDILASVCHILSTEEDNLWMFKLEDGRGMEKAMEYITPYIADKSTWPLAADVMYWNEWPTRHPALLFASEGLDNPDYLELWKTFDPLPKTQEGLRNFPIRQPILWLD